MRVQTRAERGSYRVEGGGAVLGSAVQRRHRRWLLVLLGVVTEMKVPVL